jgi:hypothetical protein
MCRWKVDAITDARLASEVCVSTKKKEKSPAKRKSESRKRMREKGMVPKEIWVYPDDWPEIKNFIEYKKSLRYDKK